MSCFLCKKKLVVVSHPDVILFYAQMPIILFLQMHQQPFQVLSRQYLTQKNFPFLNIFSCKYFSVFCLQLISLNLFCPIFPFVSHTSRYSHKSLCPRHNSRKSSILTVPVAFSDNISLHLGLSTPLI